MQIIQAYWVVLAMAHHLFDAMVLRDQCQLVILKTGEMKAIGTD